MNPNYARRSSNHLKIALIYIFLGVTALSSCYQIERESASTSFPADNLSDLSITTNRFFALSGICSACHRNMVDRDGKDVSLDSFWQGTMMANSAWDPYWQASVRAEVMDNPDYDEIIQDKCATCHTPMARTTDAFRGESGVLLDEGFLNENHDLHDLAMEGISCTLCHQIEGENFGVRELFDGNFEIDLARPKGERINYGPYEVSEESIRLMQSASGFMPEKSLHIQEAEICGSCHTLYTPTVDNTGTIIGLFPEQMPYLEWRASSYVSDQTCQDCHMPVAPGEVILSSTGGTGREQFSTHSFAGGNLFGLKILRTFGDEMGIAASKEQINAAIDRAAVQLAEKTAVIKIENAGINGSTLTIDVSVKSRVGHKFPTGFPSRRVWLHLVVSDSNDEVIFESGSWDDDGKILENDNDLDSGAYEPHYQSIDNPDQVQIYEAIMGNVDGAVTTTLLKGDSYLKDNRLVPDGFKKASADEDIAVVGGAFEDSDFQDGEDRVRYLVSLDNFSGPLTILVELCYQSIGYRWAMNLARFDAFEPNQFLSYYVSIPNIPFVVSSEMLTVEGQPGD